MRAEVIVSDDVGLNERNKVRGTNMLKMYRKQTYSETYSGTLAESLHIYPFNLHYFKVH